jgi:3',5'-nucleoside bisphosphate phosphatase
MPTAAPGPELQTIRADLHVHTVGSACAEIEMTPPLIVRRALALRLGLIAITDHNSAENAAAVMRAAKGTGLTVLPGMEVQTREEVHLVCLFGQLDDALAWQDGVYAALPDALNDESHLGAQLVVDAEGGYIRHNERLLLTSTRLTVEQAVAGVRALRGLVLAAHVDRPSYSILSNLGFVPDGLELAALEITARTGIAEALRRFPTLRGHTLVRSGDAHRLDEMQPATCFEMAQAGLEELALALRGEGGRQTCVADVPG